MIAKGQYAIAGIGVTAQGRLAGRGVMGLAAEAFKLAIEDCGLKKSDVDGLLVQPGVGMMSGMGMGWWKIAEYLQLEVGIGSDMQLGGATAGAMVHNAMGAIEAGLANYVAIIYADNPFQMGPGAFALELGQWDGPAGNFGASAPYSMACRRHMHIYGTTHDQLGAIAVAQRAFAQLNPGAMMGKRPMTLEDYHNTRWVTWPFHLVDCCLISDGAGCIIVTSAERAAAMRKPPAYILGIGQAHHCYLDLGQAKLDVSPVYATRARDSGDKAFRMAGVSVNDVDICEFYDCYTFTVLNTVEDYGFCKKGEGGPYCAEPGRLGPGGTLPINTGGGELSAWYHQGMTPLEEGVWQVRGEAGERQIKDVDICLVSGNGGIMSSHSTTILSPLPS